MKYEKLMYYIYLLMTEKLVGIHIALNIQGCIKIQMHIKINFD